ncbi:LEA type 2 family protein, partial [Halarchaeum acidiphilum]
MDLRALALGTRLRSAVTAILCCVVIVVATVALGWVGVPTVAGTHNAFGDVNETTTTVDTSLTAHNPNPIAVRLGGVSVDYTVSMNGIGMAYGEKRGVDVGTGNSTLRFESYLRNERIPAWWVSHVRNGEETTVTVAADVKSGTLGRSAHVVPTTRTVTTNISDQFNSTADRPIDAGLPLVSDPVLVVDETRAHWGTVTNASTPLETAFVVHNPKSVPVAIGGIGYNVTMNGVDVGEGESENTVVIPAGGTRTVRAETVIDNDRLDEWWVTHLRNGQTTHLVIDFYARLSAGDGPEMRVPLHGLTYRKTIETDIFGTKNESAGNATAGAAGNDSEGGSDAFGTGSDGGAANDTPTHATTTGDGILGSLGDTSDDDATTSGSSSATSESATNTTNGRT